MAEMREREIAKKGGFEIATAVRLAVKRGG